MQNFEITVDDTSPIFHYSPSSAWFSATSQENANLTFYFQNTTTYTNVSQANVTFEFWGNSIQIFGSKNQDHGNYRVQIDDQVFDSLSGHSDSPAGFQQRLFERSGLLGGKHAVVVTNMQEGMVVDIDFVTWETVMDDGDDIVTLKPISDDSEAIVYSGLWDVNPSQLGTFYGGTGHETKKPGSSLEFTFIGTALAIYGPADPDGAPYTVQVDNSTSQNYSFHASRYVPQSLLFFQGNMSNDKHTVTVTHAGMSSNDNNTLAIDFMNVYSPSTFKIRTTVTGGGISPSTIAAIILGVIVGLLLLFMAIVYLINRGKKLGQFEWNIFNRDCWGFKNRTEVPRRLRRGDITEGFELDGEGYFISEAGTRRNEPRVTASPPSVTSRDGSGLGLISSRQNAAAETVLIPARPNNSNNKQRWSFSGLSVVNQPLVIPKSSMGIIGADGANLRSNFPSGPGGQRNFSVPVPIPLPPGLAGTSGSALGGSNPARRETVLSWKPGPEDAQSPPLEVPAPLPTSQFGSGEFHVAKGKLRAPEVDSASLSNSRIFEPESGVSGERLPALRRVHQFGSEGSLPLRPTFPELDGPLPPIPSSSERLASSMGQMDLLLHRTPIMPGSPSGAGGYTGQIATRTTGTNEASEMLTPTSGPSERSSTSIDMSRSKYSSNGGGMSSRPGHERPRSIGSTFGPRVRTPRTPHYRRGNESGELPAENRKHEG